MICIQLVSRQDAISNGLKNYFTGKPCPRGHIAERSIHNFGCVICLKNSAKSMYKKNGDALREKSRIRAMSKESRNRRAERRKNKAYREREYALQIKRKPPKYSVKKQDFSLPEDLTGKERKRVYARIYYHHNKEKIALINEKRAEKRKFYIRNWAKEYRSTKEGKSISFMRKCVARCLQNKTDRTHEILGYKKEDLIAHIEGLFEEWMTWDNHGEWHIDHIIPVSAFIKSGDFCPKKINALSNLRPISAKENLSKGAKQK